jgi:hypothetical protein
MTDDKNESACCSFGEGLKINNKMSFVSHEQMQREVDYVRAQQILTSMLEKGLITLSEFNKITELNRKTFSPLLAEIMP